MDLCYDSTIIDQTAKQDIGILFKCGVTVTNETRLQSLRVFPLHWAMDIGLERFRETVSDHLPFTTTFRITRDAD